MGSVSSPAFRAVRLRWLVVSTAIIGLPFLFFGGCRPTGDVQGQVTYRGKIVVFGVLQIFGSDGLPRRVFIRPDGTFEARGLPIGEAHIAVFSPDPQKVIQKIQRVPATSSSAPAYSEPVDPSPFTPDFKLEDWFPIPPRASKVSQSRLRWDVRPGVNSFNVEIDD